MKWLSGLRVEDGFLFEVQNLRASGRKITKKKEPVSDGLDNFVDSSNRLRQEYYDQMLNSRRHGKESTSNGESRRNENEQD